MRSGLKKSQNSRWGVDLTPGIETRKITKQQQVKDCRFVCS
jgi:hypothetical protein